MHRHRLGRAALATCIVASLLGFTTGRADAAPGPFSCQPGLYQVISGQLKLLDPIAGTYTDIGAVQPTYNAMGYNVLDDHLYAMGTQAGVNQAELLRIANDGSVTSLGVPTGLPVGGYVAGDMDDQGHLTVRASSTTLYSIDVMATPPTATLLTLVSGTVTGSDLVWIDGVLYAASDTTLSRVDLATLTATTVTVAGLTTGGYGAAWSDQPDHLFVSNNSTGVVWQISDFTGATPTATARLTATVTSNNDGAACKEAADPFVAPTAADDTYLMTSGRTTTVTPGVLANDTGTDLTVASNTAPAHGTLVLQGDGSFAYTPTGTYVGTDTFTYTAVDRFGRPSGTATVTITVSAPPGPDAVDDAYTAVADTPYVVEIHNGLASNDDGTTISVSAHTLPGHGVVAVLPDGSFTYTPADRFHGVDTFDYTVCDPWGQCATGTATINVELPAPPVATGTAITTPAGAAVDIGPSEVIRRTLGVGVTLTSWTQPANGTVEVLADGTVRYAPAAGFTGDDSFTYTVTDRYGRTATATVLLTVYGRPAAAADADAPPATLAFTGARERQELLLALGLIGTGLLALGGATHLRRRPAAR
jgi:hypothetical protein